MHSAVTSRDGMGLCEGVGVGREMDCNPVSPIAKGYKRSGSLSGLKCNNRATWVVNEIGKTVSANVGICFSSVY